MTNMDIYFNEKRDSFVNFFIIAALSGMDTNSDAFEKMREKPRMVTMQINGVEVEPETAILRLEEEFRRQVKAAALELFNEAKYDILEPFEATVTEMTSGLNKMLDEKLADFREEQ